MGDVLWERVEREEIGAIDAFFAENFLFESKTDTQVAADLLLASRQGHLCIPAKGPLPHEAFQFSNNLLYLQRNWVLEGRFVSELLRLRTREIDLAEPTTLAGLNKEQEQAVREAFAYPFSIIIGGPGTGKSYTALQLISSFLKIKPDARIAVCAPTGKAASLFPAIGCRAGTIHALLGLSPAAVARGETTALLADLVIVDESSMIEAPLFCSLLGSIGQKTRVVLMGDPHQLPPVGSGSLFADLITAIKNGFQIPLTELKKSLRTNDPKLIRLREAIQNGNEEEVLYHVEKETIDLDLIWDQVTYPTTSFCLISCLRKGPFGVDALNQWVSQRISTKASIPILINRSDARLGLYNGEIGVLAQNIAYFSSGRSYPVYALPSFEYAYVLSVHKSQGSEYDRVVLLVPEGAEAFGREILYTAATRAKQELVIYGKKETVKAILRRGSRKISGLCERLKDIL